MRVTSLIHKNCGGAVPAPGGPGAAPPPGGWAAHLGAGLDPPGLDPADRGLLAAARGLRAAMAAHLDQQAIHKATQVSLFFFNGGNCVAGFFKGTLLMARRRQRVCACERAQRGVAGSR